MGYQDAILQTEKVVKGGTATYTAPRPKRPSDANHNYIFSNWDKELTNIQADTDFHAVFVINTVTKYLVTFKNPDGEVLDSKYVKIGDKANYYSLEFNPPCYNASAKFYYTFSGWDPEITEVTDDDQVYTAEYSETFYRLNYTYSSKHYTVSGTSFKNATGYYIPDTYNDGEHGSYPVTGIAKKAFDNISNSKTLLKLGKNITSIAGGAFNYAWFSKITLDEGSIFHTSEDGHILYNGTQVVMIATRGVPILCSTYSIPSGATSLAPYAIAYNHDLRTFTLPDTVTSIGGAAFEDTQIQTLNLGKGVTTIGDWAFSGSTLPSLTLPKTLTKIDTAAFASCSRLTSLTYEGTKADWAKVSLGTNWRNSAAFTTVTCSDGSVTL